MATVPLGETMWLWASSRDQIRLRAARATLNLWDVAPAFGGHECPRPLPMPPLGYRRYVIVSGRLITW